MKKLTILMLVVVMVLGLMLLAVGARGPVNKATGEIWVEVGEDSGHLEFDVHDREGEDKGIVYWWTEDQPGGDWIWLTSPVLCCNVVGENIAWFVVESEAEGVWIVIKVVDGGSPGADYDEVYFEYVLLLETACAMVASATEDLSLEATIVGGNLVVHYYGTE